MQPSADILFCRHDGLARGSFDLKLDCQLNHERCDKNTPRMTRYDGYRNLEEPVSAIISCVGPRDLPLNESDEDAIWAYKGVAKGIIL